jgi:hypothetical protein
VRKNALTNLVASCNCVFGTGEQRIERLERGSESHIFETALKSVARDDKTSWNAMSKTYEPAERCSFAAKQARIGSASCAEHLDILCMTHDYRRRETFCTGS